MTDERNDALSYEEAVKWVIKALPVGPTRENYELARSVLDAIGFRSWEEERRQLQYHLDWFKTQVLARFQPPDIPKFPYPTMGKIYGDTRLLRETLNETRELLLDVSGALDDKDDRYKRIVDLSVRLIDWTA